MAPNLLLLLICGGGLSLILVLALFWSDGSGGKAFTKRLARVSNSASLVKNLKEQTSASLRRRTSDSEIPFLDKLIKTTLPNPEKLRTRLARTGHNILLSQYLLINALAILVFYLVFSTLAAWPKGISFFSGIALGLYLPHMITGRMGNRRVRKFLASFPEAIDTICRGLRSGLPITEMIGTVGQELKPPISTEFLRISDGVRMGRSIEDSMWEVAGRLDTPEFRFFVIALAIQRETGGNLAETLGNLGELLRKRRQLQLKIRAMSSEAKASAMIIGSLPFVMFTLLMFVNSDYVMTLMRDSRGQVLMGGGMSWLGMGIIVMKQMIHFEI